MPLRLLLLALCAVLVSCAPQTLPLEYPSAWKASERHKPSRWVVAYPASHAGALAPLTRERARQGHEVVALPDISPDALQAKLDDLQLGSREEDSLLLVGNAASLAGLHHRMRGKQSDSRYGLSRRGTTPLFPVGRLPSRDAGETGALVTRILAYEKDRQQRARQTVFLVANPMAGPDRMRSAEFLISLLSKRLIKKTGPEWALSGAADVRGHPYETPPEQFTAAFRQTLNQPYVIGSYFGHSNARIFCVSAGKVAFRAPDWKQLKPATDRGLFLSCGCYSLENPEAHGYQAVRSPAGPVAFIGATGESYGAIGYLAAKGLSNTMAGRGPDTVGEWWINVQLAIASEPMSAILFTLFDKVDGSNGKRSLRDQRLEHLEMWMLLGDPGTRLFAR